MLSTPYTLNDRKMSISQKGVVASAKLLAGCTAHAFRALGRFRSSRAICHFFIGHWSFVICHFQGGGGRPWNVVRLLALSNLRRSDMPGWRRRSILIAALVLALAATARAQESERAVAEWVIRLGGSITPEGRAEPIRELEDLPPGDFQIVGSDLTGTQVVPEDLHHLSGLRRLKELFLPGPMWNEGAGSKRDSNDALAFLNTLLSLEKLHFSLHFLTNVNIQDKGLARLDSLTQLKELRLAQSKVTGSSLAPFVNLRSLDLSYSQVNDEGLQSLEGMKNLQRLLLQDTLVTDAGLRHLKDLTRLEELDVHGCRIS